jgi:hypothetical protein
VAAGWSDFEVQDKVFLYLATGVRVVWIVDPVARNVTIYRAQLTPELAYQILEEPLLPGFCVSLQALFSKLSSLQPITSPRRESERHDGSETQPACKKATPE